jgi:hypothetical protein
MNTPLLTDSQASSALIKVNALNNTLARHAAKGINAHDSEGVVQYLFTDSGGNSLSPLSLVLGGAQANTGTPQKVYLPIAQNPQSIPTKSDLLVKIYNLYDNQYLFSKPIPGRIYYHISSGGQPGGNRSGGDGPGYHINPAATFVSLIQQFVASEVNFPNFNFGGPYIAEITGNIVVDVAQNYTLSLYSDDASWLFIDGNLVVDNSWADGWGGWEHDIGPHTQNGVVSTTKTVFLTAGSHSIRIVNQQDGIVTGLLFALPVGIQYETLVPTGLQQFDTYTTSSNLFNFNGVLFTNQDELNAGLAYIILSVENSSLAEDVKTAIITQLRIQPYGDIDATYSVVVNSVTYRFRVSIVSSSGSITVTYTP